MSCNNSKCNPCGPSEDAMNAIANRANYYARVSQNAADQVAQFNTVYLGAKATAPTLDNFGNALIVGALYFNTVTEIMYSWDGTSWISAIEQKQICKAWVNFNGTTSPGTIRSSYNVSSVTKNGTGDYTVNFATAMADANYSISPGGGNNLIWSNQLLRTTTQFQLQSGYVSNTAGASILQDSTAIYAVIFGN